MQQKDGKTKRPAGNLPLLIGVASAAVAGLVALTAFALRRKKMNVRAEALTDGKNKKKKEDNSQNLWYDRSISSDIGDSDLHTIDITKACRV